MLRLFNHLFSVVVRKAMLVKKFRLDCWTVHLFCSYAENAGDGLGVRPGPSLEPGIEPPFIANALFARLVSEVLPILGTQASTSQSVHWGLLRPHYHFKSLGSNPKQNMHKNGFVVFFQSVQSQKNIFYNRNTEKKSF